MMNIRSYVVLLLLSVSLCAFSQRIKSTAVTVSVQANEEFYEFEGAYSFHFSPVVSFGAAAQLQFSYKDYISGTLSRDKSVEWSIDENDSQILGVAISPFVRFCTPGLVIGKLSVSGFAEPMLKMPILRWDVINVHFEQQVKPNTYKNWQDTFSSKFSLITLAPAVAFGVELRKDEGSLVVGYHLSTQDIFRQARTINIEGVSLNRSLHHASNFTWGLSLGLRIYFEK